MVIGDAANGVNAHQNLQFPSDQWRAFVVILYFRRLRRIERETSKKVGPPKVFRYGCSAVPCISFGIRYMLSYLHKGWCKCNCKGRIPEVITLSWRENWKVSLSHFLHNREMFCVHMHSPPPSHNVKELQLCDPYSSQYENVKDCWCV